MPDYKKLYFDTRDLLELRSREIKLLNGHCNDLAVQLAKSDDNCHKLMDQLKEPVMPWEEDSKPALPVSHAETCDVPKGYGVMQTVSQYLDSKGIRSHQINALDFSIRYAQPAFARMFNDHHSSLPKACFGSHATLFPLAALNAGLGVYRSDIASAAGSDNAAMDASVDDIY